MNPAQTADVSGRRIGPTFRGCVHTLTFPFEWYGCYLYIVYFSFTELQLPQVDLSREYWTRVFEPSLVAWESGATPNPDIWCNKFVRMHQILQHFVE